VKALHAAKERKSSGEFVAEGPAAVTAALTSKRYPIVALYVTEMGAALLPATALTKAIFLSDTVMAAISTVENARGVLAICSIDAPVHRENVFGNTALPLIFCSEVNDPGNLGTIIRTADALGSAGVLLSPGSADPFSPKVVRATAGSLWHIPILRDIDLHQAVKTARENKRAVYGTDGAGKRSLHDVDGSGALWIFGNEARGLPKDVAALADEVVAIPMRGRAESLNLATAVAITLFHANS
jgi:TrmH family RNA methyltransferase